MPDMPRDSAIDSPNQPAMPDKIQADLNAATESIADAAGSLGDTARSEMAEIKDAAAAQLADASQKAKGFASEHKDVAAQQVGGVSSALARVADDLASDEQTAALAGYARSLADNARRASDTLRGNSVDDLVGMAQRFGRRQPVAFLGIAALAGFAAGRFAMASARRMDSSSTGSMAYDADNSNAYGSTNRDDAPEGAASANSSNGGAFK